MKSNAATTMAAVLVLVLGAWSATAATVTITRTIDGDGSYPANGGTVGVSVTFSEEGTGALRSLSLVEKVPGGWTYAGIVGTAPGALMTNRQRGDTVEFVWMTPPTLPATLSYSLNVPSGQTGTKEISGTGTYNINTADDMTFGPVLTQLAPPVAGPKMSGRVIEIKSGAALRDVQVAIFNDKTGAALGSATTGTDGKYEVAAPDDKTKLRLAFSKSGYDSAERSGIVAPLQMKDVELVPQTPDPPTDVTASAGGDSVLVKWKASLAYDIAGYKVYRSTTEQGPFNLINQSALITDTQTSDLTAVSGESYYYAVSSMDKDGHESPRTVPVLVLAGVINVLLKDISDLPGAKVRIPISVTNASGINPAGMGFNFYYPKELVQLTLNGQGEVQEGCVNVVPTAITAGMSKPIMNYKEPGRLRFNCHNVKAGAETLKGEGHLFDVILTLKSDAAIGASGDMMHLDYEFDGRTYPGVVMYDYTGMPPALPVLYDDTGRLSVAGECKQGDLDFDGIVTRQDAEICQEIYAGLIPLDDCLRQAADMNGDGFVDIGDAIMIARIASNMDVNPVGPKASSGDKAAKAGLHVLVAEVTARAGQEIAVPISIVDAAQVCGVELSLSYPPELVLLSPEPGSSATEDLLFKANPGRGYVVVGLNGSDELGTGEQELAILHFRVDEFAKGNIELPVTLNDVALRDKFAGNLGWNDTIQKSSGKVTVEKVVEYDLTINVTGSGTVNPPAGTHTYTAGQQVTLTATPASKWRFRRWEGAITGSNSSATLTMDGDKTVTAVFETGGCVGGRIQGGPASGSSFRHALGDASLLLLVVIALGAISRRKRIRPHN